MHGQQNIKTLQCGYANAPQSYVYSALPVLFNAKAEDTHRVAQKPLHTLTFNVLTPRAKYFLPHSVE